MFMCDTQRSATHGLHFMHVMEGGHVAKCEI